MERLMDEDIKIDGKKLSEYNTKELQELVEKRDLTEPIKKKKKK